MICLIHIHLVNKIKNSSKFRVRCDFEIKISTNAHTSSHPYIHWFVGVPHGSLLLFRVPRKGNFIPYKSDGTKVIYWVVHRTSVKNTHTHTHTYTATPYKHTSSPPHTYTHTYLYIPSNVDPPFFFRNQFFYPWGHTHQKIYMVIVDLTDTHGLVCDMVLSNRGPPYPYYTPYTVLNAFLCDQQSSGPPLKYEDVHSWQRSTFACKNPDACPRLQVYTDPHTHTHTKTTPVCHINILFHLNIYVKTRQEISCKVIILFHYLNQLNWF